MIIKKYVDGTGWVNQTVKTTAADIYTSSTFATSIFNASNKIKPEYLPDEAFGGLDFQGALTNAQIDTGAELAGVLYSAYNQQAEKGNLQSMIGMFWIASETISSLAATGTVQDNVTNTVYWCIQGQGSGSLPSEEGDTNDFDFTTMEAGDWLIVTGVSGDGTSGTPFVIRLVVVNNTYQAASSTASGIMKLFSDTAQSEAAQSVSNTSGRTYGIQNNGSGQMVVNVPWVNTTYSAATSSALGLIKLEDDTVQTVAAEAVSTTANRTYGLQVNSSGQGVVNVPWVNTVYTHPTHNGTSSAGIETTLSDITLIDSLSLTNGHIDSFTHRKLVAGTNVTITPASNGNITIAATDTNTTYTASDGLELDGTNIEMVYPLYVAAADPTGTIKANAIAFVG